MRLLEQRPIRNTVLLSLFLLPIVYLAVWYRGDQVIITAQELQYYQERLNSLPEETKLFVDVEASLDFLQADDGKPFYVINLFKFSGDQPTETLVEVSHGGYTAFSEFTKKVMPLWLKHGTHPVFATSFEPGFDSSWDYASVVRYRSRRDLVEIQTSDAFVRALPYRLAATEKNLRIKLPGSVFPAVFSLLILLLLSLGLLLFVVIKNMRLNKKSITDVGSKEPLSV